MLSTTTISTFGIVGSLRDSVDQRLEERDLVADRNDERDAGVGRERPDHAPMAGRQSRHRRGGAARALCPPGKDRLDAGTHRLGLLLADWPSAPAMVEHHRHVPHLGVRQARDLQQETVDCRPAQRAFRKLSGTIRRNEREPAGVVLPEEQVRIPAALEEGRVRRPPRRVNFVLVGIEDLGLGGARPPLAIREKSAWGGRTSPASTKASRLPSAAATAASSAQRTRDPAKPRILARSD